MNKTENNTIQLSELIYLAYFTVMFGARAIGLYEGMLPYNMMLVAGMLLFLLKIAMTRHTFGEYLLIGVLLFISLIVYYNTGEKGLLLYFTMMLGMKGVSVRRVLKMGTIILSISFVTLVLLSVTGIKEDIIYIHDRAGFGKIIRHSLGYPYPNTLFTTYIVLMVLIVYMMGVQNKKDLLLTSLFLLIGALYIYLYSCSNTGIIVAVFYLIINLYLQFRPHLSIVEKAGIMLVYPLCDLIAILGPLVTTGKMFQVFDKILHNRWAYSLYYLTNEPITMFGTRFKEPPNTNYMIDSSFLYSFLQIGVVPFIILTIFYMVMIYNYVKNERKVELAIIISFCLLGMSDPFLFNLSYKNLLFLFIGEVFYDKLQSKKKFKLEMLNREIQILPIGNKVLDISNSMYQYYNQRLEHIRRFFIANRFKVCFTYLIFVVVVVCTLFRVSWSEYITERVDQINEWEYVRGILSIGIWGSLLIVAVIIILGKILGKGKKHKMLS